MPLSSTRHSGRKICVFSKTESVVVVVIVLDGRRPVEVEVADDRDGLEVAPAMIATVDTHRLRWRRYLRMSAMYTKSITIITPHAIEISSTGVSELLHRMHLLGLSTRKQRRPSSTVPSSLRRPKALQLLGTGGAHEVWGRRDRLAALNALSSASVSGYVNVFPLILSTCTSVKRPTESRPRAGW